MLVGAGEGFKGGIYLKKGKFAEKNCTNTHESCEFWAANFECETNPEYMLVSCRKACMQCAKGGAISAKEPCADENTECSDWASNGECSANPSYMRWKCKRSCGIC